MMSHKDKVYLFGGQNNYCMNEMRVIEEIHGRYRSKLILPNGEEGFDYPNKKYGHTMVKYRKNFVIFGGGSDYDHDVKLRQMFNDLKMFNLSKTFC
jgi:hypothetical protein